MNTNTRNDSISRPVDETGVCCENMIDICTKAEVAEHARFSDEDYPCTCL